MEIVELMARPFDASTERRASTFTDTLDPDRQRKVRVWDIELIPPEELAAAHASAQAAVWERIKAERDRRTSGGGFRVVVDGSPYWFHSDTLSRSQHMGMFLMGAALPAGIMWKTMSGTFVEMTPAIATAVFYAAAASDQAIFAAAEAHKAAMLESPHPAAHDFTAGWPVAYGEDEG